MKNFFIIVFVFIAILTISGCDISPVYMVRTGDVGITTQNGEIIGNPKRPGLNFKIPIYQKVHMVNIAEVRILSIPLKRNDLFGIKVYWSVKDAIKFSKASELTGDDKKIELKILPVFIKIIDNFISEKLHSNSQGQNNRTDLSNGDLKHIENLLQGFSLEHGINIVTVEYEKK
ncbi:MAG: SPFH domain-containing protein [Candidatus Odinarchaeota archaeon]